MPARQCATACSAGLRHRQHVHAVHLHAGNAPRRAVLRQIARGRRALDAGAHAVFVVLDHIDDGQLHQRGEVEALEHLPLAGCAFAEIGDGHPVVAAVPIAEAEPGAEADLCADDAVPAEEVLLLAEHVHRPALAVRVAASAARQLRHDAARVHAGRQHMAVVAVGRDHLVAVRQRHLHADDNGLLADVQMAEAADQPHAVELSRLLLEAADQQHVVIGLQEPVLVRPGRRLWLSRLTTLFGLGCLCHGFVSP